MFSPNVVFFGKSPRTHVEYLSREAAALVSHLAQLGLNGEVKLPADADGCAELDRRVRERMEAARARFRELAESRADERMRNELVGLCERWFVLGRNPAALMKSRAVRKRQ
jgi:hypothetical protein